MSLTLQTPQAIPIPLTPPGKPTSPRMIQLDVLRGVAILAVLGSHAVVNPYQAGMLKNPAKIWEQIGGSGVDLFFVLSGFLVGGLLMVELRHRGRLDVRRFIIRRAFKIWPAYYAFIVGSLIVDALSMGWRASFWLYLPNLLHVQNYFGANPRSHTWSLAVEEHFYLALPLLLWLLTRINPRRGIEHLPMIAVAVMVAATVGRCLLNGHLPYNERVDHEVTHWRIDSLAMGVLLAYFYHFRPAFWNRFARHRWTLILLGLALISPMAVPALGRRPFVWTIGYTMLYVGYACILVAFVHTPVGPTGGILGRFFGSAAAKLLATIGFFSYGMYLWHINLVRHPLQNFIPHTTFANFNKPFYWLFWMATYVAAVFVVGAILSRLIEIPALALRDRLFPTRTAHGATARS
jgi:peptidoglycan/LPS O-acetylase OafA/YrhL